MPPALGNPVLSAFAAGVFAGEGAIICANGAGPNRRESPEIAISICDDEVVERVSSVWGAEVLIAGKYRCRERSLKNPSGSTYRVEARGLRAKLLMDEMIRYGLVGDKVHQWHEVVQRCPL